MFGASCLKDEAFFAMPWIFPDSAMANWRVVNIVTMLYGDLSFGGMLVINAIFH